MQFRRYYFTARQHLYFILLFLSVKGNAQQSLQAVVNYNVFFLQEKEAWQPYLEVYFDIDPRTVLFEKKGDTFLAKIRTDIEVKHEGGSFINDNYFLETTPVTTSNDAFSQRIIDLRKLYLKNGKSSLSVKLTDQYNKDKPFLFQADINIPNINDQPFLSNIQLLDTVIATTKQSVFKKNNRLQIPFAVDFLEERKLLHIYAELYQLTSFQHSRNLYLKTFISKKENEMAIYQLTKTDTVSNNPINIIEGSFNISVLPSGNYFLNMQLIDSQGEKLTSASHFLQVLNKSPEEFIVKKDTALQEEKIVYFDINKSFTAKYSVAQIRAILKMLLPIADAIERKRIAEFLKSNDEMYARYFVYNFWLSRDKNEPEKTWKDYAEKVKVANRLFGSNAKPGYETDRGFIQLKYGSPDDRIEVLSEEGALPYEVWQYNSLPKNGNALFLFYKPANSIGNYELLHSTVLGERKNLQWRSLLYMNGVNNNNIASKAEFYFGNR